MLYGDGFHDDTYALQCLLNDCGIVTIDRPGIYLVSKTLIIRSNTRLVLAPGVRLLTAPMARCTLIQNEHFAGDGRDENIEIIGGIWDGNCDEMGLNAEYEAIHRLDVPYSPTLFKGKMIRFAHVDRISLEKMTIRNPISYGVQIGDTYGFVVRDLFFDYNWHFGNTDGVHINGPACDGVIENLCGTTNDDMVSLTTYDEPHAEISVGDIENVSIRNISSKNGYSAIRLLSGENCSVRNIHIDGIYGDYRHNGVIISNHNQRPGKVWFDNIVIEHVYACKSHTPLSPECFCYWEKNADKCAIIGFGPLARCGRITIRDLVRHETKSTEGALISIVESAAIDRLYLENIHQTTGEGATAPLIKIGGNVKELITLNVCGEEKHG